MEMLDVRALHDDEVQVLQQLVEFFRQKHQVSTPKDETETIDLRSWSLGVKGNISREEIYEYLDAPTNESH